MNLHQAEKKLGRRISFGEWERIFSALYGLVVHSRRRGSSITMVMRRGSPKWMRKHHAAVVADPKHSRRARYEPV